MRRPRSSITGSAKDGRLCLKGQGQTPLSPSSPTSLTAAGAFLKQRSCSPAVCRIRLDRVSRPNLACFCLTAPAVQASAPVSPALSRSGGIGGRYHLNAETALTRDHHADLFLDAIIEGPSKWSVRPVAEFFVEKDFGQFNTVSALVGLIWQVRDNLSFDVGFRHALTNGHPVNELRAGLTFGFPLRPLDDPSARSR